LTSPSGDDLCSAKGCHQPAVHELRWNNPKLHTPDRRKVWLACDEHRQSLAVRRHNRSQPACLLP